MPAISTPIAKCSPIIIIGAGIAGLASAIAFQKKGYACILIEKNEKDCESGYGIQLGPRGIRQLQILGLDTHVKQASIRADYISIFSHKHDTPLCRFNLESLQPYWLLPRYQLYKALYTNCLALQNCQFYHGMRVVDIQKHNQQYIVTTHTGMTLTAAIIIDASGYRAISKQIMNKSQDYDTPYTALRYLVSNTQASHNQVNVWLLPNMHIVGYPINSANLYNYVIIYKKDTLQSHLSSIRDNIMLHCHNRELRQHIAVLTESPHLLQSQWPLYTSSQDINFFHEHIAYVGDSAQPVLPFLAQGASLALEEANILAESLADNPSDLDKTLLIYSRKCYNRRKKIRHLSQRQAWINAQTGVLGGLRNISLRFFSRQIFSVYRTFLS